MVSIAQVIETDSFHAQVKSLSSSVDPQPKEDLQPLQSAQGKGDTLSGRKSPESKKQNRREETDTRKDCPPERYLKSGLWKDYYLHLDIVDCYLYSFC